MQRVGAALDHAQAAAEVAQRGLVAAHVLDARQQAAGDGLDGRQRVRKLVAQHADQPLPGRLFFFLQRQAHVGQQQQRVRRAVLAEEPPCASSQRVGFDGEGVDGLVGRGQQVFQSQFARGVAEAAGMGAGPAAARRRC